MNGNPIPVLVKISLVVTRVNHGDGEFSRGFVYTNTAESYFALLKRGVMGIFHHVSKGHLHRYCDEFSFRWNYRKVNDGERAIAVIKGSKGKRLAYRTAVTKSILILGELVSLR